MGERRVVCVCMCVSVVFVGRNPQAGSLSPNPNRGPAGTRTHRIDCLHRPKGQGKARRLIPGAQLGKFFTNDRKAAGGWSGGCCLGQAEPSPGRAGSPDGPGCLPGRILPGRAPPCRPRTPHSPCAFQPPRTIPAELSGKGQNAPFTAWREGA